jgi:hypothetical protein
VGWTVCFVSIGLIRQILVRVPPQISGHRLPAQLVVRDATHLHRHVVNTRTTQHSSATLCKRLLHPYRLDARIHAAHGRCKRVASLPSALVGTLQEKIPELRTGLGGSEAGLALRDRRPQGCGHRAYMDVFTACLVKPARLQASLRTRISRQTHRCGAENGRACHIVTRPALKFYSGS